jgi:hypothetical protein
MCEFRGENAEGSTSIQYLLGPATINPIQTLGSTAGMPRDFLCVRGHSAAGLYEFLRYFAQNLDPTGTRTSRAHHALDVSLSVSLANDMNRRAVESRGRAAVGTAAVDYALRAVIALLREPVVGNTSLASCSIP